MLPLHVLLNEIETSIQSSHSRHNGLWIEENEINCYKARRIDRRRLSDTKVIIDLLFSPDNCMMKNSELVFESIGFYRSTNLVRYY